MRFERKNSMPHCLLSGRGRTPRHRDQSRHDPEVPVKMCQDCALVANLSFGHAETVVQLGIPPLSTLYGLLARLVHNSDFTLKSARFQNLESEIWSTFFRFQNQKSANIFRYSESFKIWNLKSKKCAADFDGLWFWENMLAAFLKIWNLPCSKFCWQISVKSAKQIFSKSEICTVGKSDFPRIWNLPFKIWNLLLI